MNTKNTKPTTVLVHGVWDVLHHGHIDFFMDAKDWDRDGTILTVSVTDDPYVNKGPGRPVFDLAGRVCVLQSLTCVDRVVISEAEDAVDVINREKPDIYAKGREYRTQDINGRLEAERAAVESHGGKVVFIDTEPDSSSRAINIDRPTIPEDAQQWIKEHDVTWKTVDSWLQKASKLEFNLLGEEIWDEYTYVQPAGKSPKENYVNWVPQNLDDEVDESWLGGIDVINGHASQVAKTKKVSVRGGSVRKHRYVQLPFLNKVFATASVSPIHEIFWGKHVGNFIIADFGHNVFDQFAMKELHSRASWVAATIQANGLNFGYNRINKWTNLNYIACDRTELQLANPGIFEKGIDAAVTHMMEQRAADAISVTLGHEGARLYTKGGDSISIPAFNDHAADRIGAGDAWYGWTAPLVRAGAPIDVIAFVGACAAAVHVATVGNEAAKSNKVHGFMRSILA